FSIGEIGDLQAVATRADSPTDGGLMYWDDSLNRLANSGNATVDGSGNMTLHSMVIDPSTLNSVALAINRYNAETDIFQVGEHDAIGSSGSFGGAVIHSANRALGISTNNGLFPELTSTEFALYIPANENRVAIGA